MDTPAAHFTTVFLAFFAIMNPVANAPLFVSLTEDLDRGARRRVATRAVILAFGIVAMFIFAGNSIFHLFGITLPAFRITGGALVVLVGYHMLHGERSPVHSPSEEANADSRSAGLDIAICPLALPILAGPGTIATAMNFSSADAFPEIARVLAAFAAMCLITWAAFLGGESMTRFLGQNGIKVVTRLMGLILAVVGVQMLITGIRGAIELSA